MAVPPYELYLNVSEWVIVLIDFRGSFYIAFMRFIGLHMGRFCTLYLWITFKLTSRMMNLHYSLDTNSSPQMNIP